ncbi:glycine cleavage system protein T [Desulfotomaculum copahuensis]|uniref:Aminomethyltransferase n=1 Tax=Desulfotomaculum copahuensis TaxID=1838280 RepID=A0A1B7LAZ2_9FIRM|nr:glycine cleavage system protein T [Desulfotomaculum copahuensis]
MHVKYGGRMIDFGGWELPVQYTGIIDEHRAVRERAGLFDVSHMGEIRVAGTGALPLIQKLITNDAAKMSVHQAIYSPVCLPSGGIVDDILVYRPGESEYLLVVNAANKDKDWQWIRETAAAFPDAVVEDISDRTAQLALQGPLAERVLGKLTGVDLKEIRYYWSRPGVTVAGVNCLLSRTGYTGGDGFELYCPPGQAPALWEALLSAGRPEGLVPAGLGARDTLRLEAAMPLYGNELNETTTPLEAGLGRFVSFDKGHFTGREILQQQKANGVKRKLVGFEMIERGIPRHGYAVVKEGREIGVVTSGTQSPALGKAIGLAYVPAQYAGINTELAVVIRNRTVRAGVVPRPFYRKSGAGTGQKGVEHRPEVVYTHPEQNPV